MWFRFKPYVSVARRRLNAAHEIKNLEKRGQKAQPVRIEGLKIARTFWGKAWCDNLESYSDYSNRLPRGRTYVRNGSVCDLQIKPGVVTALVCGSELYEIKITIAPAKSECWAALKRECSGQIGAVIELLRGSFSNEVMQIITRPGSGLFPNPKEIQLSCSCPDWAGMCKHVAAAMYGVGARLDQQPELLFALRQVDPLELITDAGNLEPLTSGRAGRKTIHADALSDVFGIDMIPAPPADAMPADAMPIDPGPADHSPAAKTVRKVKRPGKQSHGRAYSEKTKLIARQVKTPSKMAKRAGGRSRRSKTDALISESKKK